MAINLCRHAHAILTRERWQSVVSSYIRKKIYILTLELRVKRGFTSDSKKTPWESLSKIKFFCRICRSSIAYSENTSNQTYHLQKQHLLAFKEVEKERKHNKKDDEKQAKQLESYSINKYST